MANVSDKSILTAAGKALLAQLNAEEKALVIDKMIFANVPNRPEYPQPDDVVPTDNVVHQAVVEQRGRLSEDSVIYSTTLASNEGPFEFNWTGAYCSEYGVLVTIDHHSLTPKTVDEPGVSGNTLVRSVVLEYKDIAEITNITVDASTWQYNATPRMKKMDDDVAQANIDQNGKDWFIEDGFLVTPQASAFSIKAGAGYVSGNRVALDFDRSIQVPNKPSFIYIDAHREGTPTGEQVTLFNFVVSAEEKDDYIDSSTGKDVPHFVCKIAQVLGDGSVSDLRPEGESASRKYVNKQAGNSLEQSLNMRIWPAELDKVAQVGDLLPDGTQGIRVNIGGQLNVYMLSKSVSGQLTGIDTSAKTIEIGNTNSYLLFPTKFSKKSALYIGDFIDDIKYLQQLLDWNKGGVVHLSEGKKYTANQKINIPKYTRLNLDESHVEFFIDGADRGFVVDDYSQIYNGKVTVNGTNASGSGILHSCVSGGNQTTGQGVKGCKIFDLEVDTNRVNGNAIVLFGESKKNTVEDIEFPTSNTIGRVIAFEWGGDETFTGHPHNNKIKRITGGQLTGGHGSSYVVWLSSVFNTNVSDVYCEDCYGLVGIFTGDKANQHAPDRYKDFIGKSITVKNVSGKTRLYGVRVYGKGMEVQTPLAECPILDNITIKGTGLSDSEIGVLVELTSGVVVNNPRLFKLGYGVLTGQNVWGLHVNGGEIYLNRNSGIKFGNVGGVYNCKAESIHLYQNNQNNNVGVGSAAAINLAYSRSAAVINCRFGKEGHKETQVYSVYIEENCTNTVLRDNYTTELNGGIAYVNGSSEVYSMNTVGENNRAAPGIPLFSGSPIYTIDALGRRHFTLPLTSGFPTGGEWVQGDTFEYGAPAPSDSSQTRYKGAVYTVASGWVTYGEFPQ